MTESIRKNTMNRLRNFNFNLRSLRLSLKYRPDILKLIVNMRYCLRKKNTLINNLKKQLKESISKRISEKSNKHAGMFHEKNASDNKDIEYSGLEEGLLNKNETKDTSTQTECITELPNAKTDIAEVKETEWNVNENEKGKSIAEQVKEVAQSALQQSGMVYVESTGMYYDYKTGYYYNSELGLYYHTDTGCYYYYSDEKSTFVFHSYPDRSAQSQNASLIAHEKRKAKKHKVGKKNEDDIESLTKNLSQEKETKKSKRRKIIKNSKEIESSDVNDKVVKPEAPNDVKDGNELSPEKKGSNEVIKKENEFEEGECSDTESEEEIDERPEDSTSTASDDDSVARHHPPCMRVIVRETKLAKLKVGSLFLITKDGGTIGREGEQHTILLRDHNVSRIHLDIKYDEAKSAYTATDLGSKNGTILNGIRMSESQETSKPIEVLHGSTIQLGETKLLCHIHPGNDTCGHCEPGLLMETEEKEKKVAYTRTCSVQKQHQLELARLKNKYAPKPLMIEEKEYNDRAQARRDAVGSSHHAEKTQSSDLETFIAPENKGFKLLEKMGWSKGEGLGKDNQGDVEPIPLVSNDGKSGLGTSGATAAPVMMPLKVKRQTLGPATLRLASKTKMLQPPAKAFQTEDDDDEEQRDNDVDKI